MIYWTAFKLNTDRARWLVNEFYHTWKIRHFYTSKEMIVGSANCSILVFIQLDLQIVKFI